MFIMSLVGDNPGVEVDRRTVNSTPKSSLRIGVGARRFLWTAATRRKRGVMTQAAKKCFTVLYLNDKLKNVMEYIFNVLRF